MIVIAGTVRIDPANQREAVAAARDIMSATRQETGCVSYTFSSDLEEEGLFHVFEQWQAQEHLDAHFKTPHMASFQKAMGGLGVKEMDVKRYEVSKVGSLGG
jgi:quinol monooxygenase YgiN